MSLFTNALFVLTVASAGLTAVPAVAQLSVPSIRVVDGIADEIAQTPQGKGCCKKKECKECTKECREKCGKKTCKECKKSCKKC